MDAIKHHFRRKRGLRVCAMCGRELGFWRHWEAE
jgi:ribosomal protein L34E